MDIKRLITQFTYRIEQKPGGGFIAHASDPAVPPLEAPTRMELQQKIQESINASLTKEFPQLKLGQDKRVLFHLERQADGGFAFHSTDPNLLNATPSASHEVESHFAEKMFSLFGNQIISHLPPEFASQLPPELAGQLSSGNVKVFIEKRTSSQSSANPSLADAVQSASQSSDIAGPGSTAFNGNLNNQSLTDSPITPERGKGNVILRFLIMLAAVFGAMYLYLHFHR